MPPSLRCHRTAVLATSGPAGVQASEFPCEAIDLNLYLLVPQTSDHLFNLEHDSAVTLLTPEWELRGARPRLQHASHRRTRTR